MNGDALSDLLLALVTLPLAWRLGGSRPGMSTAFLLIGVAAVLGVPRYMGVPQALGPHRFFSLLAACAAPPPDRRWQSPPAHCKRAARRRLPQARPWSPALPPAPVARCWRHSTRSSNYTF
jgi:hypothetical protein